MINEIQILKAENQILRGMITTTEGLVIKVQVEAVELLKPVIEMIVGIPNSLSYCYLIVCPEEISDEACDDLYDSFSAEEELVLNIQTPSATIDLLGF